MADSNEDSIMNTLVNTDQFMPSMRMIFERSRQRQFREKLETFVDMRGTDIQQLCNSNYKEFIRSVDELWGLNKDAVDLKWQITQLNDDVQTSGRLLLARAEELLRHRQILRNIGLAKQALADGQQVLSLFVKAADAVAVRKFYAALKTLDQLQKVHLRRIAGHPFAVELAKQMKLMRADIKDTVTTDFNEWLVEVRKNAEQIGRGALTSMHMQLRTEEEQREKQRSNNRGRKKMSFAMSAPTGEDEDGVRLRRRRPRQRGATTIAREGMLAQNQVTETSFFKPMEVDCTPVYTCVHVYDALGQHAEFKQYYSVNRSQQARLSARPPQGLSFAELSDRFLCQLVGFFVVEDMVMKSSVELMSSAEVDALWDIVMETAMPFLRDEMWALSEPTAVLACKDNLLLIKLTLQNLGFNVNPMLELLEKTTGKYEELLLAKYKDTFKQILHDEMFQGMEVKDAQEYEDKVVKYSLHLATDQTQELPADPQSVTYPFYCPFSATVPKTCEAVMLFMDDYYKYIQDVMDDDDVMRRATDMLLDRCCVRAYADFIDHSASMGISQAVQISLNTRYLEAACAAFEAYAGTINTGRMAILRMDARQRFEGLALKAETAIFEMVDIKLGEFMNMAEHHNWIATKLSGATDYVEDMVQYFEVALKVLDQLPDASRDAVYYTTCKNMANRFLELLTGTTIKRFTNFGFAVMQQDVNVAVAFAQRSPAPNSMECFSTVRQLLDLILTDNIEVYMDESIRQSKYPHVAAHHITAALAKIKDIGTLQSMTTSRSPYRLKKKQAEAFAKRLKNAQL